MSTPNHHQSYQPRDAAAGWALTLLRPLLHPVRRTLFEEAMSSAFDTWPEWCHTYVAGVVTCLVATLPDGDPWRHISARSGATTAGQCPPPEDGVVRDNTGRRFGTWRDATDIVLPVFSEPESDPSLAELADHLSVRAGLLLAAAGAGEWRSTRDTFATITSELGSGVDDFGRPHSLFLGRMSRDVAREAIAWAMHRRMAYGGDVFCEEILLRWTTLATRVSLAEVPAGRPEFVDARRRVDELTDDEVRETIGRYRVPDDTRDNLDNLGKGDEDCDF